MNGRDFFPREDERDWARQYDHNLRLFIVQNSPRRNFELAPVTALEYQNIYQNLVDDQGYVSWRNRRDAELEGQRIFWKGVQELDLAALPEITFDRPRLQAFKIKYDTLEEVRMRYNKTIILVKGNPYYVSDQRHIGDNFYLLLEDNTKKKTYIDIQNIPDLRPPPPGYLQLDGVNGYFMRLPARVNQQGLTNQSCRITKVGSTDPIGFDHLELVDALSARAKTLKWEKTFKRLLDDRIVPSFRLSDKVALYKKPTNETVVVEYKGRRLGALDNDHVIHLFDEDDAIQPWLKRDVNQVDLEVTT